MKQVMLFRETMALTARLCGCYAFCVSKFLVCLRPWEVRLRTGDSLGAKG